LQADFVDRVAAIAAAPESMVGSPFPGQS